MSCYDLAATRRVAGLAVLLALTACVRREAEPPSIAAAPATPTGEVSATPTPSFTPVPLPSVNETPPELDTRPPSVSPSLSPSLAPGSLIIPVAGIRPDQLVDTYSAARSEGRIHNAIDIIAPHNAEVLAAAPGKILRLFDSEKGGKTIYQMGEDNRTVYYYAHLDHYAEGVAAGQQVAQGKVIAYVGDTGNAGAGNYHLHFAIWTVTDPKQYWDGVNLNPYPLLRQLPSR